jgi:hypothetical protein
VELLIVSIINHLAKTGGGKKKAISAPNDVKK